VYLLWFVSRLASLPCGLHTIKVREVQFSCIGNEFGVSPGLKHLAKLAEEERAANCRNPPFCELKCSSFEAFI